MKTKQAPRAKIEQTPEREAKPVVLITASRIADYLGISLPTLRKHTPELPVYMVGGVYHARTADLDKWIEDGRIWKDKRKENSGRWRR